MSAAAETRSSIYTLRHRYANILMIIGGSVRPPLCSLTNHGLVIRLAGGKFIVIILLKYSKTVILREIRQYLDGIQTVSYCRNLDILSVHEFATRSAPYSSSPSKGSSIFVSDQWGVACLEDPPLVRASIASI